MTGPAEQLDALAVRDDTVLSVWVGDTDGTPWLTRLPDTVHLAASTMKLPLAIAVHRLAQQGRLALDEELLVSPRFTSLVSGEYEVTADYDNDDETWRQVGATAPVGWLVERAIVRSSNLATNLLIARVGHAAVDEVYELSGATSSRLRKGIQDTAASEAGIANTATAGEMAGVLCALLDGRLLPPDAVAQIERLLAANEWNDAIPAGLPTGTYVAHKTGWIDECCHDVGVLRPEGEEPFVLSVFTTTTLPDEAAHAVVAEAAGVVWRSRDDLRG